MFGKARVILEAMACGRAAYVFDHNGGEGWVTGETFDRLAADNFGGQSVPAVIDEERLVADLAFYDSGMGIVNRDLVVAHNAATKHTEALVELLHRVALSPRDTMAEAPLRELARVIRLRHRADMQAFAFHAEAEALASRTDRADEQLAALSKQFGQVQAALVQAHIAAAVHAEQLRGAVERENELRSVVVREQAEAAVWEAEAHRHAAMFQDVTGTRRWRTLNQLLAPADRLRSGSRNPDDRHRTT